MDSKQITLINKYFDSRCVFDDDETMYYIDMANGDLEVDPDLTPEEEERFAQIKQAKELYKQIEKHYSNSEKSFCELSSRDAFSYAFGCRIEKCEVGVEIHIWPYFQKIGLTVILPLLRNKRSYIALELYLSRINRVFDDAYMLCDHESDVIVCTSNLYYKHQPLSIDTLDLYLEECLIKANMYYGTLSYIIEGGCTDDMRSELPPLIAMLNEALDNN